MYGSSRRPDVERITPCLVMPGHVVLAIPVFVSEGAHDWGWPHQHCLRGGQDGKVDHPNNGEEELSPYQVRQLPTYTCKAAKWCLDHAGWMYLFIVSRDVQLPILGMHSGEVLYRLKVWLHAVRWKLAMDEELDISCAARNLTANECRRPTGKRACRAAGAGMAGRDCVGQLEPHALSLGGCTLKAASSS